MANLTVLLAVFTAYFIAVCNGDIYDDAVDASVVGSTAASEWSNNLPNLGKNEFDQGWHRMPSPTDWPALPVYQIMVDRFNNGDASNDKLNRPKDQVREEEELNGENLYNVFVYKHGGDLRGATNRLNYVYELGFRVVYLTSVFHNDAGDYHGYCVSNPLRVDTSFGDLSELQTFVHEAHKLGIRVVLDFVINHICDTQGTSESDITKYTSNTIPSKTCSNSLLQYAKTGSGATQQNQLQFSSKFFKLLKHPDFFSRCAGSIDYSDAGSVIYGDFRDGMFDINTNDLNLINIMTNMANYWIGSTDIDGYRLDAAKHVTQAFLAYFSTKTRNFAASLGKDNFLVLGEAIFSDKEIGRIVGDMGIGLPNEDTDSLTTQVLGLPGFKALYESPAVKQQYPGMTAVYDFRLSDAVLNSLLQVGEPRDIELVVNDAERSANLGASNSVDVNTFWVFLGHHDRHRILHRVTDQGQGPSIAGQAYTHLAKGTPIVFAGDELAFNGFCPLTLGVGGQFAQEKVRGVCDEDPTIGYEDSLYRQGMWVGSGWNLGSQLPSINSLAKVSSPSYVANPYKGEGWTSDPFLTFESDISQAIRRFNRLRTTCTPLEIGIQKSRYHYNFNGNRFYAFSRIQTINGNLVELLVVVNFSPNSFGLPDNIFVELENTDGTEFVNVFDPSTTPTIYEAQSRMLQVQNFQLPAWGVALFAPRTLVTAYDADLKTRLCTIAPITNNPTFAPTSPPVVGETKPPSTFGSTDEPIGSQVPTTNSPTGGETSNNTTTAVVGSVAGCAVIMAAALLMHRQNNKKIGELAAAHKVLSDTTNNGQEFGEGDVLEDLESEKRLSLGSAFTSTSGVSLLSTFQTRLQQLQVSRSNKMSKPCPDCNATDLCQHKL